MSSGVIFLILLLMKVDISELGSYNIKQIVRIYGKKKFIFNPTFGIRANEAYQNNHTHCFLIFCKHGWMKIKKSPNGATLNAFLCINLRNNREGRNFHNSLRVFNATKSTILARSHILFIIQRLSTVCIQNRNFHTWNYCEHSQGTIIVHTLHWTRTAISNDKNLVFCILAKPPPRGIAVIASSWRAMWNFHPIFSVRRRPFASENDKNCVKLRS